MISIRNGVDLVEIDRLRNLNPKIQERFLKRVFTTLELGESGGMLQHLAGKFAAKEAASKALGCGIGQVGWQELEILKNAQGEPRLLLHGQADQIARQSGWQSWSVSISHTQIQAVAVVTVLVES